MELFKKKEEVKSKYVFYDRNKEKINKRSILYIIIMILVGICIVFSLSTYLRWHRDIESRNEVLLISKDDIVGYYNDKDEFIEVTKLIDFYDAPLELNIRENEAIVAYCGNKKSTRNSCISINPSNGFEQVMRKPFNITNFLIIIELLLLFVLFMSLPSVNKLVFKLISVMILLYGLLLVGLQIFNISKYYFFVNNNENFVDGIITKEIKDSNMNGKILPVIEYKVEDKEYTYYSFNKTSKKINDTMTLYYKKKDYNNVTEKKNPIKVFDLSLGIIIFILGLIYLIVLPKKVNLEKEIEKINYESDVNA